MKIFDKNLKPQRTKIEDILKSPYTVQITFSNGEVITTRINGTVRSIEAYYRKDKFFNIGREEDCMATVSDLIFIN